jgi:DNA-directed RNA polymerase specialized sigma24 family protein
VGEPDDRETRAELAAILKSAERKKKLYALARGFAHGAMSADDLMNTACVKLLSGKTPWRRSTHPDLVGHLGSVMATIADHDHKSAYTRRQRLRRDPAEEERAKDDRAGAEEQLLDVEAERRKGRRLVRWLGALREERKDDSEVTTLVDCFEKGAVTAAEQVDETGWPIERVRRVRRRLFETAEKIMDQSPDSSGPYAAPGAAS